LCFKSLGYLKGTVASEVEEYDTVAILDGSHRFSILGDDERGKVLVDGLALLAQRLDGLMGAFKHPAFTQNMSLPTLAYHIPVCIVSIHGDDHAAAAAGNPCIEGSIVQRNKKSLEGVEVFKCTDLADIAAVEQGMDANLCNPILLGLHDHSLEVVDVRVNVSVAEQTDEVQR